MRRDCAFFQYLPVTRTAYTACSHQLRWEFNKKDFKKDGKQAFNQEKGKNQEKRRKTNKRPRKKSFKIQLFFCHKFPPQKIGSYRPSCRRVLPLWKSTRKAMLGQAETRQLRLGTALSVGVLETGLLALAALPAHL